jgi:hypothetical protein
MQGGFGSKKMLCISKTCKTANALNERSTVKESTKQHDSKNGGMSRKLPAQLTMLHITH